MQRFCCLTLIAISSVVDLYPGILHALDELDIKLASQEESMAACAHAIPSTEGISSLYIPYLFVVLFTENDICSLVLGQLALNLQSILTSEPGKK